MFTATLLEPLGLVSFLRGVGKIAPWTVRQPTVIWRPLSVKHVTPHWAHVIASTLSSSSPPSSSYFMTYFRVPVSSIVSRVS